MNPTNKRKLASNLTVIGVMDDIENRFDIKLKSIINKTPLLLLSKSNYLKLRTIFDFKNKQIYYFDPNYFKQLETFSKFNADKVIFTSGDPGYFGALRSIKHYFSDHKIVYYPTRSSVSLAFSLLTEPWDDATIISTLGRPLYPVLNAITQSPKAAVFCTKALSPSKVAKLLTENCNINVLSNRQYYVISDLDKTSKISKHTINSLIASKVTSDSILLTLPKAASHSKTVTSSQILPEPRIASNLPLKQIVFGEPIGAYKAVRSMITKPEVRAIVLSKLSVDNNGTLLEIGAGSGSISIEAVKLAPLMRVISFEKDSIAFGNLKENMKNHNVVFETHLVDFYNYKGKLPKADRILIGGGKLDKLNKIIQCAKPGARVVGVFASLDRAQKLAKILGNLVQVNINVGNFFADETLHLTANNPVFIVWGQLSPT